MDLCRRYRISGRVQGVFYRASTRKAASSLGLVGWVRNCSDGSVEVTACGSEDGLLELEQWLWHGPAHAEVSEVRQDMVECQDFSGFEIVG